MRLSIPIRSQLSLNSSKRLPVALVDRRAAVTRIQGVIIIVVVVVAAGAAGAYFLSNGSSQASSQTSSGPIALAIIETDPVNQVDNFNPTNVTVSHDTSVTLAIRNGDDAPRNFQISAFNVNQTIGSGVTARITITVGPPGTFKMSLPPRPANPAVGLKASPEVVGYLIVK